MEMSSFSPLVSSMYGGMSKCTEIAYKRSASLLADKQGEPYMDQMPLEFFFDEISD